MNEAIWVAFEKYGYTIGKYLTDTVAREAMDYYGKTTATIVRGEIRSFQAEIPQEDGDVVLVAGHAICNNFLAYHLSGCKDGRLLKIEMGEAERIRLIFENGVYVGLDYSGLDAL